MSKVCKTKNDVPTVPHWVILEFDTYRTDDGYGGNYTNEKVNYIAFENEDEWKTEVGARMEKRVGRYTLPLDFIAVKVSPCTVHTSYSFEIRD